MAKTKSKRPSAKRSKRVAKPAAKKKTSKRPGAKRARKAKPAPTEVARDPDDDTATSDGGSREEDWTAASNAVSGGVEESGDDSDGD